MPTKRAISRDLSLIIVVAIILVVVFTAIAGTTYNTRSAKSDSSGLFQVAFIQAGACDQSIAYAPWSVKLGSLMETLPSDGKQPPNPNSFSTANGVYSEIVFSVPSGNYSYKISPNVFNQSPTGYVDVNGSNVSVGLTFDFSCTVSTSATGSRLYIVATKSLVMLSAVAPVVPVPFVGEDT